LELLLFPQSKETLQRVRMISSVGKYMLNVFAHQEFSKVWSYPDLTIPEIQGGLSTVLQKFRKHDKLERVLLTLIKFIKKKMEKEEFLWFRKQVEHLHSKQENLLPEGREKFPTLKKVGEHYRQHKIRNPLRFINPKEIGGMFTQEEKELIFHEIERFQKISKKYDKIISFKERLLNNDQWEESRRLLLKWNKEVRACFGKNVVVLAKARLDVWTDYKLKKNKGERLSREVLLSHLNEQDKILFSIKVTELAVNREICQFRYDPTKVGAALRRHQPITEQESKDSSPTRLPLRKKRKGRSTPDLKESTPK
jgi:hypothetical protein